MLQVLQEKAVDGDRMINNAIEYEITSGPGQMFGINKNTGTVYSKAIIDRESDFATYGTFILGRMQASLENQYSSTVLYYNVCLALLVSVIEIISFRALCN